MKTGAISVSASSKALSCAFFHDESRTFWPTVDSPPRKPPKRELAVPSIFEACPAVYPFAVERYPVPQHPQLNSN
jgi:hypothetical protein